MAPFRTGLALAITVVFVYALCTLAWVLVPGPFLGFMNNLFHGMDFTPMVQQRSFDLSGFVVVLLVQSGLALLAGAFFAWLLNRLTR